MPRLLDDPILLLDLLNLSGHHFGLRDRRLLVLADHHARRRSSDQLPGTGAGGDDELERIGELAAINHGVRAPFKNELTIVSADGCIRSRRERSATTMLRSRSTADVSSSLTTTKSYSANAATSSRATCSRRWISVSLSLLRPRSRCSSTALALMISSDTRRPSAFDPIVFTSRFISCSRKSSLRPHGSGLSASALQWDTWTRKRVTSSLMSERAAMRTISCATAFSSA